MSTLRILHTADWHLDQSNLEFSVPVIEQAIEAAPPYDLFVFAGDIAVHRGAMHPDVVYHARRLLTLASNRARYGGVAIAGNHDMSFKASSHSNIVGIVGGADPTTADATRLVLFDRPGVHVVRDPVSHLPVCSLVMVPTPSKYEAMQYAKQDSDLAGALETVISGLAAEAEGGMRKAIIGVYHGSVGGVSMGNEQVMKSGVDLTIRATAFMGMTCVLAGHIHLPQRITAGGDTVIHYPGTPVPLTWGENKINPRMLIHTVDLDTGKHTAVTEFPVLVESQMLDLRLEFADDAEGEDVANGIAAYVAMQGIERGDRVRLTVRGPRIHVDKLDKQWQESVRVEYGMRSFTFVGEPVECDVLPGSTVGANFSMELMFREWAKTKVKNAALVERAAGFINEIEGECTDMHLDAHYECKPIRVTAHNWCQFEDVAIDFDKCGNIVAVEGPNFSGKSNVARIIAFARYKRQVAGDRISDLVRKGESAMSVCEEFMSGGAVYRVIRNVKLTANGGARSDLFFSKLVDGEWITTVEGTANETQALIESLIGPWELFAATTYAGQNDVDGLLDLTPSELKDLMTTVLQRDFDYRLKAATQMCNGHMLKLAAVDTKLADQVSFREKESHLIEAVDAQRDRVDKAVDALAAFDATEIDKMRTSLAQVEASMLRCKPDKQLEAQKVQELSDAHVSVTRTESIIESGAAAERFIREADELKYPTHEECAELMKAAGEAADARAIAAGAYADAASNIAVITATDAAEDRRLSDIMVNTTNKHTEFTRKLREALRDSSLLNDVPCGGRDLKLDADNDDGFDIVQCGKCEFIADAQLSTDTLPSLRASCEPWAEAVAHAENDLDQHRERVAAKTAEHTAKLESLDAIKKDKAETAAKLKHASDDASRRYAQGAELREKLHRARESVVAARAASSVLDSVIALRDRARRELDELRQQWAEYPKLREAAERTALDIMNKTNRHETLRATLDTERDTFSRLCGALDNVRESLAMTGGLEKERKEHAECVDALTVVSSALHRDGIPFMMLTAYAIPTLQGRMNDYLQSTDVRVIVESSVELVSGKQRAAVAVTFTDHRGRHPVSAASGYQRTVIGMAMRNALADLHASATGSRIWLSIQDEGFGTMDEPNLDRAKATLRLIAERRGWFLFISHIAGMNDIADTVITVRDRDGISTVEVN